VEDKNQRDRSRRRPDGSRMPKSRAIKSIDEDMKLNKALWEMAEVLRNGRAQKKFIQTGERIKPSPESSEPKSLCNISGFCLIPQSFVGATQGKLR